ncbi:unnamed protein product [Arctia plantaginis]|uniref:Uncharacterized protein n=1 Tax=Arctia plantaginis TaxID=874455 RepID=A0A8S0ZVT5_ARCPL|nr:unnamed protein product [Arctia plantaginis]CAB3238180.1 unnamed protein product [Arctia plantaginis]
MLVYSNSVAYGSAILSLFVIDYMLGHGFVDAVRRTLCRMICFVKRIIKEESKTVQTAPDVPINLPVLLVEILLLSLIIAFLNKYKQSRNKDPIDDLLKKSRDALRQTNEFLDKWRLKRVPLDYSYMEDDPVDLKPLKLEVPVLHMAVLDNISVGRSQPERRDAGDSVEMSDTALLSVTSLVSDDFDFRSVSEPILEDKSSEETKNIEFRNRYLWDVMEEDANSLDE